MNEVQKLSNPHCFYWSFFFFAFKIEELFLNTLIFATYPSFSFSHDSFEGVADASLPPAGAYGMA
jgi:hypothetical protein